MFLADLWRYSVVLAGAGLCLSIEADLAAQHSDALLQMIAALARVLT
ncbi:hypothetical protein [Afipia felis]|uniref:Uncharacterized protein n=2 Tax=Afipia felis TaxID=1035 RepID=A0A380W5I6_AFIFE|nr:hypothetical protein [Afipia felis]EKS26704.1 hypothetical protein HMPREF9697_04007 [Afipia felis ATCC 53690]SUU76147.1 Uncharacterised protein [Afipia felis]SUU84214.1 Uncharacterised protein [Afipia felis]SUW28223.1 Uncharacterised protein [Afipia felis]